MTRHFSHATKGICCCDERARERGGLFFHKTAIDDDDDAALNSESEHCIDAAAAAAGTDRRISQRGGGLCVHNFAPKTKNICMRVMKGWGKKLADSLWSSVAVERIQRTARPEGLMRRAIRKQPRLIAARTASDIAGSGGKKRRVHLVLFRVKVELHITGDISLARRRVEWSLSPPPRRSRLTGKRRRRSRQSS